MKNIICHDKGRPKTKQIVAKIQFRPRSKKARDKFFELGGSKWINRILDSLC